MRKIERRAYALLLLLLLLLAGVGVYITKYVNHGAEWASFSANKGIYSSGELTCGTVTDRNGVVLSEYDGSSRVYASDKTIRVATLHAVGDRYGYIGTGALKAFASRLVGYNLISGSYSLREGGNQLTLTISAEMNATAYKALDGKKGTVAVCNYETGELLCMVSSPSYDPENPPESFESDEYEGVFINRFLSSRYTPGSTFKLVTLAAALEQLPDLEERIFSCDGSVTIGGSEVTCTKAHGEQTISQALANSCNCVFGTLACDLGADTLAEYTEKCGLTSSCEVDGISSAAGRFDKAENDNDLAWSGIGQYHNLVNPASMLRFVASIAGGGKTRELRLIASSRGVLGFTTKNRSASTGTLLEEETAEKLTEMMRQDTILSYGEERFAGMELCAKSGTAEVGGGKDPHALFVGFLQDEEYPLAFIVVVENGGTGSKVAGNVAKTVLSEAIELIEKSSES